jgi:hypothetical protein
MFCYVIIGVSRTPHILGVMDTFFNLRLFIASHKVGCRSPLPLLNPLMYTCVNVCC